MLAVPLLLIGPAALALVSAEIPSFGLGPISPAAAGEPSSRTENAEPILPIHRILDLSGWSTSSSNYADALSNAQEEVSKVQEKQESLNRRLRSGQFTEDFIYDYASASSEETQNVLHYTTTLIKPFANVLRRSIANLLMSSYLLSVTSGATLYASYLNSHQHSLTADDKIVLQNLTSSYNSLVSLSRFASLDADSLAQTTENIAHML